MTYPASGHRIDVRKASLYGDGLPLAPFSSRLIHANYADREIIYTDPARKAYAWGDVVGAMDFVQADTSKQSAESLFTTKDALLFDNANDTMVAPATDFAAYAEITVCLNAELGSLYGCIFASSPNVGGTAGAFYIYENAASNIEIVKRNTAVSRVRTATSGAGVKRIIIVFSTTDPSAIPIVYVNGVLSASAAPGASDCPFTSSVPSIGMQGVFDPWGGKLGDLLIYGDRLSAAEAGAVDAFLAARAA